MKRRFVGCGVLVTDRKHHVKAPAKVLQGDRVAGRNRNNRRVAVKAMQILTLTTHVINDHRL